jgi:hypothetical protein
MHHATQRPSLFAAILLTLAVVSGSPVALAQADTTASKSAEISAFAGYTNSSTDYGRQRNTGGIVGVDYTRFFGWRVAPALEIRAYRNSGELITQEAALGGLRLQGRINRFHPYGDVLAGGVKIVFKIPPIPTYTHDNTFTTSFGGGVDIDIVRNFQAKIDFQAEFANYGPNNTRPNNEDFTLTPRLWNFGIVYRIPFHGHSDNGPR